MAEKNLLEELKSLIEKSSLTEEDKNFWFGFFEQTEKYKDLETKASIEKAVEYLLAYLQEEPDKLQWLTDIFRRKIEALGNLDKMTWEGVLKDEVGVLTK